MPRTLLIVVPAAAVILAAGGVALSMRSASSRPTPNLTVTASACASGWTGGSSGVRTFAVYNRTSDIESVDLVGSDHLLIYGQATGIAAGTTHRVIATLPAGNYSWRCTSANGVITFSPSATISGPAAGAHPYAPVSLDDLVNADLRYRDLVTLGLNKLLRDTDALVPSLLSGARPAAEAAWLTAHLDFARLGAAHDTFGDRTAAIDGSPAGLPGGVLDPHFTGFGRLEYGLWHNDPVATLVPIAAALDTEVHALAAEFPRDETPTGDPPLRAHEILENALQFDVTAENDQGSHTNLATARADVDATTMVLNALRPLLASDRAAPINASLARLIAVLETQHHADGTWTPIQALSFVDRQRIDGALDGALELLAPLPDLLTPPQDTT